MAMKQYVYADNAATTKMDKVAYDAMTPFLLDEYGNASQPYAFAREPKKALQEAREIIASCIGAMPNEIYFTSGGTESDNWVIKAASNTNGIKSRIVTSDSLRRHRFLIEFFLYLLRRSQLYRYIISGRAAQVYS